LVNKKYNDQDNDLGWDMTTYRKNDGVVYCSKKIGEVANLESVTFKVEGIKSENDKINVINVLHKYSGVLDIGVDMDSKLVRVKYDPSNIRAEDMQQDIEKENYHVVYVVNN